MVDGISVRKILLKTKIPDIYVQMFPQYPTYIKRELVNCNSILDIGCGSGSPASPFRFGTYSIGVELYVPSLLKSKKRKIYTDVIHADVREVVFIPKSFDCVICSDVLEHLSKPEGLKLIKNIESIAKKKVIIFTPNGFSPKDTFEDGNVLQEHKSGWTVNEFLAMAYEVKGALGLKYLRGEREQLKFKPWAIWQPISDVSQFITFYHPQYAYHILCIKRLN